MKYLFPYLKKYKLESIIAPLFKMLEATFDLIVPLIVADIINVGIANKDTDYILTRFGLLILMALLGIACSFVAQFFAAKAAIGTSTGLRHQLLKHIQGLTFSEIDQIGTSTLITRMTNDINQVQNGLNMFLRLFLRSPFIVFGSMIMAFTIDAKIAAIFVVAIPVLFVIVFGVMRITNPMYKQVQKRLDHVTGSVRENLSGVRVIRAFGREESENTHFQKVNAELVNAQLKVGKAAAWMNPLTYVVVNMGIIAILWIGSDKVNTGVLISGNIIALINYMNQILVELVKLANLVTLLGKAIASMGRVGQVLDQQASMTFGTADKDTDSEEAVRFEHVGLAYAGAGDESLSDISFTVKKGETVGVIGGTGSGKSSLINMIPRFYDATSGQVSLLGRPIADWSKESLRKRVVVVMQKAQLFKGTIRTNLLWGKNDANEAEMWEALECAQAAEFVRQKPEQLDEKVEQGGRNLSGGQKQRLTIARALIAKPNILILDDSSSALDYATDAALRKSLKTLPKDMTVFIVSQRISSIQHADRILVLDDGRLAGQGTHEQLLADCDIYKEIYASQFKQEKKEGQA